MSVVTAVKYLAAFATEALRPWDPSRELASRLLADLPLMQKLRADDEATADEVTHLVLIQFGPDEPPSVDGLDYLVPRSGAPREFLDAHGCTWRENGTEWLTLLDADGNDSGLNKTPAFVGSHYGPLVEVQPDAEAVA